jgi:hypothetical protein
MNEYHPLAYHSAPVRHDGTPVDNTCADLVQLTVIGAVVGGSAAAGANIRRLQRDEVSIGQALVDTGRTAVASAAATAIAGAAATAITAEGLTRLAILFAAGTAVMYGIQRGLEKERGLEEG